MQSKPRQGEGEEEVEERHRLKRPVPKGKTYRPRSRVIPYSSRAKAGTGWLFVPPSLRLFIARLRFLAPRPNPASNYGASNGFCSVDGHDMRHEGKEDDGVTSSIAQRYFTD